MSAGSRTAGQASVASVVAAVKVGPAQNVVVFVMVHTLPARTW